MDEMSKKDCISQVKDFFNELGVLENEYHRQFSKVIHSQNALVIKGMKDMAEEVRSLKNELLHTANEKSILIETVKNLNDEIKQIRSELKVNTDVPKIQEMNDPALEAIEIKEQKTNDDNEVYWEEKELLIDINKSKDEGVAISHESNVASDEPPFKEMKDIENVHEKIELLDKGESAEYSLKHQAPLHEDPISSSSNELPKLNGESNMIKSFECELCEFRTHSRYNLNKHINKVHNKRRLCTECDKSFADKRTLEVHRETIHLGIKKFKCEQCSFASGREPSLKTHIQIVHDKIERFACTQCSYTATLKAKLMYHIESVHRTDKKFKCQECPYTSATKGNLKKHSDRRHSMGEEKFKCSLCTYKSNVKDNLRNHTLAAHDIRGKKFNCDLCPFKSHSKENLKRHNGTVHNEGEKKFKCELCPFMTNHKQSLKMHAENLHGRDQKIAVSNLR